jgi:hypothetical protein
MVDGGWWMVDGDYALPPVIKNDFICPSLPPTLIVVPDG